MYASSSFDNRNVANSIGHSHHISHLLDAVDADDVGAKQDRGGDGRGGSRFALCRQSLAERGLEERLARRAAEDRPIELGQLRQLRQQLEAVLGALREARNRDRERSASRCDPCSDRAIDGRRELRDRTSATTSA